jgi:hypothetical protein
MRLPDIRPRLRALHWVWWAVWLLGMTLLAAAIIRHEPRYQLERAAEKYRGRERPVVRRGADGMEIVDTLPPSSIILPPAEILILGDFVSCAAYTMTLSAGLILCALLCPRQASHFAAVAVAIILLFFAFHTVVSTRLTSDWLLLETATDLRKGAISRPAPPP